MADRELVGDYNVKPKKDREHEAEEKEEPNIYGDSAASRTPLARDTPIVKIGGGTSIHGGNQSSRYGGASPSFGTPIYKYSQREFSERQGEDLPANSPLPSQTPLVFNASSTPLVGGYSSMSPLYNYGQTSFHNNSLRPSSQMRSPSYLYQSASSSPNADATIATTRGRTDNAGHHRRHGIRRHLRRPLHGRGDRRGDGGRRTCRAAMRFA